MKPLITFLALAAIASLSSECYANCASGSCPYKGGGGSEKEAPAQSDQRENSQGDSGHFSHVNRAYGINDQQNGEGGTLVQPHETYRAGDLVTRSSAFIDELIASQDALQDSAANPQDKQVNARIRQRLKNILSKQDFEAIIIKTDSGNVILLGTIENPESVKKIHEQVKTIEGVNKVDNQVKASR